MLKTENGNAVCVYTRGAELISQERGGNISYYLTDGHGSVRQIANASGEITDSYVYDAWGKLISATGTTPNTYLYCGEQHDDTTGLYYLRSRYMNPSTGTFTTQDTYQGSIFDPVTLHKYLYANANSVTYSDPSGYMVGMIAAVGVWASENTYALGLLAIGMMLIAELTYSVAFHESLIIKNNHKLICIDRNGYSRNNNLGSSGN